ncbi:C40 family peptidase [Ornithinimicrobium panacihumi]|uniref:C40 family peptidase n=1 Tax=Ornithinimicrobium panacihumi TaxID=2008449 RepID=UPI003F8AAC27
MTHRHIARHRKPSRLSTASTALTRTAAVAATSTGLIAGTGIAAQAAPDAPSDQAHVAGPQALVEVVQAVEAVAAAERPAVAAAAPKNIEVAVFGTTGFAGTTPVVEVVEEPVVEAQEAVVEAQEAVVEEAPVQEQVQEQAQQQAQQQVETRTETTASRDNERQAPVQQAVPAPAPAPAPAPEPAAAPAPTGGVLATAAAYTGIYYVYGGSTPAGFDCSGYTQFVFAQHGISLPRTAAAQQSYATPVSNPQPGDLVFFGYPAYHVGIYAGNGMMYDSGRPGIPTQLRAIFSGVSGYGRVG